MRILTLLDLHLEFGRLFAVHNDRGIDDGVYAVVLSGSVAKGVQQSTELKLTESISP